MRRAFTVLLLSFMLFNVLPTYVVAEDEQKDTIPKLPTVFQFLEEQFAEKYSDYQIIECEEMGPYDWQDDTKWGKLVFVLEKNDQWLLCIAEKEEKDSAYRFTLENSTLAREWDNVSNLWIYMHEDGDPGYMRFELSFTHTYDSMDFVYFAGCDNQGQLWTMKEIYIYDTLGLSQYTLFFDDITGCIDIQKWPYNAEGEFFNCSTYQAMLSPEDREKLRLETFDMDAPECLELLKSVGAYSN